MSEGVPLRPVPFCGVKPGDFLTPSCDLMDEGFELDAEGGLEEPGRFGIFVRGEREDQECLGCRESDWRGESKRCGDGRICGVSVQHQSEAQAQAQRGQAQARLE